MDKLKCISFMRYLAFFIVFSLIMGISAILLSVSVSAENIDTADLGNVSDFVTYSETAPAVSNKVIIDDTILPTLGGYTVIGSRNVTNHMMKNLSYYYGEGTIWLSCFDKTTGAYYYARYLQSTLHNGKPSEYIYQRLGSTSGDQAILNGSDFIDGKFDLSNVPISNFYQLDISGNSVLFTCNYIGVHNFSLTFYDKKLQPVTLDNPSKYSFYWLYSPKFSYSDSQPNGISLSKFFSLSDNTGYISSSPAPPDGGSSFGRFTCFGDYKDYTYDEHLTDLISESIDYTKSVDSSNYGRGTCYFIKNPNDKESFIFNRPDSKQMIRYNSTDISFTFYNNTNDLGACSIRLSATMPRFMERESDSPLDPIKFLTQHAMSYYHFNRVAVISSDSLKAIPAKSTVTATFDLTGFTFIGHSGIYLIELVNSLTGDVVSSVSFDYENDGRGFKQNNNNIDVKFKYDNGNVTSDVVLPPDDTGHINGLPNAGLDSSNDKYTFNYNNPGISDIFGTLDSSVNSISDFFQMCFSLLPLAISTIIIGGFALLVLLRVLGR